MVLLGDQYYVHCSSGREFEDQNLALWRNIHIHGYALRRSLVPPALDTHRRPREQHSEFDSNKIDLAILLMLHKIFDNVIIMRESPIR